MRGKGGRNGEESRVFQVDKGVPRKHTRCKINYMGNDEQSSVPGQCAWVVAAWGAGKNGMMN